MRICNIRIQVLYYFHYFIFRISWKDRNFCDVTHKCIVHYPSIQISNPNKVTKVCKTRFDKFIKVKNALVKLGKGGHIFISRNVRIYRINLWKDLSTIERDTTNSQGLSMIQRKEKNRLLQNHPPLPWAVQLLVHQDQSDVIKMILQEGFPATAWYARK